MPYRVTDTGTSKTLLAQINNAHSRVESARERIASGKRINRPSDDPVGTEAVIRFRTAQAEIEQVRRNAGAAHDALVAGDTALEQYQRTLDRARTLLQQGASDTSTAESRRTIASELDGLREQVLSLANTKAGDRFIFGGTRQDAPPYDANGTPAASAAAPQLLQVEPQAAPVSTGVTAETVFADAGGTVMAELQQIAEALRGTGDPVADKAALLAGLDRLKVFADQANIARASLGTQMAHVEAARSRMDENFLVHEEAAQRYEAADVAEAAIDLAEGARALEAVLQANSPNRRRSLIDLLG
jgi:flagellar hook-associated protein 3 FlgL